MTLRGTILAYCAARKDGIGDWADIDIALRRSLDGGRSWLPRQILVDAGTATADNPTAIVDHKTGAVHFLYQVNYARCFCAQPWNYAQLNVTERILLSQRLEADRQHTMRDTADRFALIPTDVERYCCRFLAVRSLC